MRTTILRILVVLCFFCPNIASALTFGVVAGWNLLGNSDSTSINVATTFGSASSISSVWKWNSTTSRWAFYAPSLTSSELTAYAQSKGYDVLTSVSLKEGFWVNALTAASLPGPAVGLATSPLLVESDLKQGWNLVASADNKTPSQLNQALKTNLSAAGKSISTLWAWNVTQSKWKFYAPTLEAQGGTALTDYIATKGYLSFGTALTGTEGFWVNIESAAGTSTGSGVPTVTGFSPTTGAVGTTVTITGTNFSTTAASNTVKFNGTQATVTAATATSLSATVPSGATSGTVSVATAAGTGTSSGNFSVSTPPSLPTITGFSPTTGAVGTTVTITGTNFSTTASNNIVKFNGTQATVTAATATSLSATVPSGATSGTISVVTAAGTAASSSSFSVGTSGTTGGTTGATALVGIWVQNTTFAGFNIPVTYTLTFGSNGILTVVGVTGSLGACTSYSGPYTVSGNTYSQQSYNYTCYGNPGVSPAYSAQWSIVGSQLTLTDVGGSTNGAVNVYMKQ